MTRQQSIGSYGFAATMIAAGMLAVVISTLRLENTHYLSDHGVRVRGTVVSGQVHIDEDGSSNSAGVQDRSYSLDVEYWTGITNGYRSFDVTEEGYKSHGAGSQIEVVYDPADPNKALLAGGIRAPRSTFPIWFGLIFTASGIALTLFTHYYNSRARGDRGDDVHGQTSDLPSA